jgi:hypothetical protein
MLRRRPIELLMDDNHQAHDIGGETRDIAWLAERSAFEGRAANLIRVPDLTRTWNPVVRSIREDFEKAATEMQASRKASDRYDKWPESRKRAESCNEAWKWQWGLDRGRRLVETRKPLAFRVSLETYQRALGIMNALALAAESRGYSVRHDKEAGRLAFTGHDSEVHARMAELLERRHRPRTGYDGNIEQESYMKPTGRLRVSLQVGYGEGPTFQDQGKRKLESQLNRIYLTIYRLTVKFWQKKREREDFKRQLAEAQRQGAEVERVRAERERQAAEELKRREGLLREAADWMSAEQIHKYLAHLRAAAHGTHNSFIDPGWMQWALGVAADLDPTAVRLGIRSELKGLADASAANGASLTYKLRSSSR